MSIRLSDYDYDLPQELIAQTPAQKRELSRLLVLDRARKALRHSRFYDIITYLKKGDLLVLNDTKVMPARLLGRRRTGGRVEILLLNPLPGNRYFALIKPLGRLKDGEEIFLDGGYSCRLVLQPVPPLGGTGRPPHGLKKDNGATGFNPRGSISGREKIVEFNGCDVRKIMKKAGLIPLPPYIRRQPGPLDCERYQTVFARREGAVAAPTAGLHFTKKLLERIAKKGVRLAYLTLHVNYATFASVRSEDIRKHTLEAEYFQIPARTLRLIARTKREGGRVFSIGTTVCKALEDSAEALLDKETSAGPLSKWSSFFIHPPFTFRVVDALVTNFHLPQTTLLMLVSAFAGRPLIQRAYQEAIGERYRFYSYGDAMLIL